MSLYKHGRTVPEFVRKYREAEGLTQEQLAKKIKVNSQYISNVERGHRPNYVGLSVRLIRVLPTNLKDHLFELLMEDYAELLSKRLRRKQ